MTVGTDLQDSVAGIPTLSQWMLLVFALLLAGWITFVFIRRWRRPQVA